MLAHLIMSSAADTRNSGDTRVLPVAFSGAINTEPEILPRDTDGCSAPSRGRHSVTVVTIIILWCHYQDQDSATVAIERSSRLPKQAVVYSGSHWHAVQ